MRRTTKLAVTAIVVVALYAFSPAGSADTPGDAACRANAIAIQAGFEAAANRDKTTWSDILTMADAVAKKGGFHIPNQRIWDFNLGFMYGFGFEAREAYGNRANLPKSVSKLMNADCSLP